MKKNTPKGQTVKLREREQPSGNKSLYLDYSINGKRKREFLKLYIVKPKTPLDRQNNKKNHALAENIRAKRQLEIVNNTHGFPNNTNKDVDFIVFFEGLMEERKNSKGNYGNWDSTLKHIIKCFDKNITFNDIDTSFVERFKKYLIQDATTKSQKSLSSNTQNSYFNKFKTSINTAYEQNIINNNPAKSVKGIKGESPKREYLTIDELKTLVKTEHRNPIMKNAFIFSCLTGLRWSDIQKLTWGELRIQDDNNHRIVFRQKKTKHQEYLDINHQALEYLSERKSDDEKVFKGLRYSSWHNVQLTKWMLKAGITKDITFHCGRHTFAVMQLYLDTNIYTVSKLLGHKDLRTTQMYAQIVDAKKREAVDNIPNISI